MRIISKKKLIEGYKKYSDSKISLESWYYDVKNIKTNWKNPNDVTIKYPGASFLSNNIVIFNIKGNKYRLVVKIEYRIKTIFILWFSTHAEYSKIKF